jgi:diketogulonate reductase-like aldo/keto reductase
MLDKYGMTPAQLMLNWVTYPEPVVAIPKAGRVSHVEENAAAIDARISEADYRALSKRFEK